MTGGKPLFILQGNGSFLNRGCEAILRSTISILQQEFGQSRFLNTPLSWCKLGQVDDLDVNIFHKVPRKIVRWHPTWFLYQVRKRLFGKPREIFQPYLPESVATLALGGDNYSLDYGVPTRFFEANRATLNHGKPLIIWGASVGPFDKDPEYEKYAIEELKKVTLICARESETVSYLESIGVRENVRAVSEPAFVLEPEPVELSGPEHILLEEACLGVNLSPLMMRYWKGERSWQEHATECVHRLLEEFDCPVILIPHVMSPHNDDHEFMNRIAESLPEFKERLVLLGRNYNCQQLKWIISNLAVFAGARTHATVASLSSCVPTVSIGYSMKARGINKDIFGHLDWLVPLESLQPIVLTEVIGKLMDNSIEVRRYLMEKMPKYKERARLAGEYIREVVSAGRAHL